MSQDADAPRLHRASGPWTWPGREQWVVFAVCALLIQVLWFVVYGGCSWLTAHRESRVSLATPLDTHIPFVPWAAAVYLSLGPMVWLAPLVLRTRAELVRLAAALAWLIVVSGVGFLFLPADAPVRPESRTDRGGAIMGFADRVNLDHNLCPSLHVGMAVVCALAYSRMGSPRRAWFWWMWAAAIAAATLLIREHYVVDVVAGVAVGLLVAGCTWAAPRADRRDGSRLAC